MLAVKLDAETELQLEALAEARHMNKSDLVYQAILRMLEDEKDLSLARDALAATRSRKPLTQLRKELALDS
ncbi:MAG: CopG-like DNA-binding protein [Magnetococcales bacterium]|nr:CopG-like DNA-binding protein [Magnetococcales bacterium]HIJ83972.1 CopG family transcriptional regulator [Magnetococcales bacterium]